MEQITPQNIESFLEKKSGNNKLLIQNHQITGIFKKIKLEGIIFKNCQFFNTIFQGCTLEHCTFQNIKFSHCDFQSSKISACIFEESNAIAMQFQGSLVSACKIMNFYSQKTLFNASRIEHTKLICSNFIATKFSKCQIFDFHPSYSTLDGSHFTQCSIENSIFESLSMRGIEFIQSIFENCKFHFVNFSDSLNIFPSEFYVPTKATNFQGNQVFNVQHEECIIRKSLKRFFTETNYNKKQPSELYSKLQEILHTVLKRINIVKLLNHKKDIKIKAKHTIERKPQKPKQKSLLSQILPKKLASVQILPKDISGGNISSLLSFSLQFILTIIAFRIFYNIYQQTSNVIYKFLPHFIEANLYFYSPFLEVHSFAFYTSLTYFAFSGALLCINVVCIRGVKNLILITLYRLQSIITIIFLTWLWWNNLIFQLKILSYFNLISLIYFCIMFYQSFNTTASGKTHSPCMQPLRC